MVFRAAIFISPGLDPSRCAAPEARLEREKPPATSWGGSPMTGKQAARTRFTQLCRYAATIGG
jgi:hypothetical protein